MRQPTRPANPLPRQRPAAAKPKRSLPGRQPLSPEDLAWCDPDDELEAVPEPGDFYFEPGWDDE